MKGKERASITIDHGEFLRLCRRKAMRTIRRDWDTMRANAEWIVQLHSPSDKLIPVAEGRFVAEKLKSEYLELERRGHFMGHELPEVLKAIRSKCGVQH